MYLYTLNIIYRSPWHHINYHASLLVLFYVPIMNRMRSSHDEILVHV